MCSCPFPIFPLDVCLTGIVSILCDLALYPNNNRFLIPIHQTIWSLIHLNLNLFLHSWPLSHSPIPLHMPLSQVFQGSRLFSHYGLFISSVSCPGLAPPAPLFYGVSLYINLLPNCYTFWFQFTKIIFFSKILQIIWWTQIYVHVTIKDQKSRCSRRVRKSLFIIQICQSSNHLIDSNLVNQSSNLVRSPLNLSLFSCTMTSKMNWLMSVIFSTFKILWFLW